MLQGMYTSTWGRWAAWPTPEGFPLKLSRTHRPQTSLTRQPVSSRLPRFLCRAGPAVRCYTMRLPFYPMRVIGYSDRYDN
jgi:hypothetical protein